MKWMGYKLGPAKDSVVVIIYIHNSLTSVRVENATDMLSLMQLSSLLTCMSLIIAFIKVMLRTLLSDQIKSRRLKTSTCCYWSIEIL